MEVRRAGAAAPPSRVEILSRERVLEGFLRVDRFRLRFERHDGTMSDVVTRLVLDRGDSVAVLPYDRARRRVLLVHQFRLPAHVAGEGGWLWEAIAGVQDGPPEVVARREAREEAEVEVGPLHHVATVYPSPGASSERVAIYVTPLELPDDVARISTQSEEGEDILVRSFGVDEALAMAARGDIRDAKTILALQHLALHGDAL